jgi:hypothetical protein
MPLPGGKVSLTPKKSYKIEKRFPDAIKMFNDPYGGFSGPSSALGLR